MVSITGTIYAWSAAGLSGANKLSQYLHGSPQKATAETKEKEADDQELRRHAENEQRHGRDDALICAVTKSTQAIASEIADYSKRSFEHGAKAMENLLAVKSLDKAVEVQSEYAKAAYEGFIAHATKLGELYVNLAKEAFRPYEGFVDKVTPEK
jgi:hypothetical protein